MLRLEGGGEIDLSPEETRFKVEDIRARVLGPLEFALESRRARTQGRMSLEILTCDMRHVKLADATRKQRHATARDIGNLIYTFQIRNTFTHYGHFALLASSL